MVYVSSVAFENLGIPKKFFKVRAVLAGRFSPIVGVLFESDTDDVLFSDYMGLVILANLALGSGDGSRECQPPHGVTSSMITLCFRGRFKSM